MELVISRPKRSSRAAGGEALPAELEMLPCPRAMLWSPKEVWQDSDAGRQALADRWRMRPEVELDAADLAEQQTIASPATFAPPMPSLVVCYGPPPAGTRDNQQYWKLKRAADKAERDGRKAQAYTLRQKAKALEMPLVERVADDEELRLQPDVTALISNGADDVFLPMNGLEASDDDPVVEAGVPCPPLTSSLPEGRAAPRILEYTRQDVISLIAVLRAWQAAPAAAAE